MALMSKMSDNTDSKIRAWAATHARAKVYMDRGNMALVKLLYAANNIAKTVPELEDNMACELQVEVIESKSRKATLCEECWKKQCKPECGNEAYRDYYPKQYHCMDVTYVGDDLEAAAVLISTAPWDTFDDLEKAKTYKVRGKYRLNKQKPQYSDVRIEEITELALDDIVFPDVTETPGVNTTQLAKLLDVLESHFKALSALNQAQWSVITDGYSDAEIEAAKKEMHVVEANQIYRIDRN